MSDNFGTLQNRVLTVIDRNLDNVIFQYKIPPLTSEWNLINQIGNEKIQALSKVSLPSGWISVGGMFQDLSESNSQTGQVLCSINYKTNYFKLISRGDNIAIVNGWPLLIQETNSTDDNNKILLDTSTGQFYDFIFLEVWRKLVSPDGTIYKYGNVYGTPYGPSQNEIKWNVINTETTKRVQIQYRIRHIAVSTIITSPINEIFDIMSIHPQAGATSEISTYSYQCYGPSDPGLYIAGAGTSSQSILNTVDGYSYAIPMFLVYRRVKSDSLFNYSQMRRTYIDSAMSTTGYVSDRPDGKISDIIYKEDIIDLRHKIIAPGNDAQDILNRSISKIISGDLSTSVKLGFGEDGSISSNSSGGNVLLKAERICSDGSEIGDTYFKRRAYCNAEVTLDHNIVEITYNGTSSWVEGSFTIASKFTLPDGEIISVDGFYSNDAAIKVVTGVTTDSPVTAITIGSTSSLIGTSNTLLMEFTFKYYSSSEGFYDVPKEFIEVNKNDTLPIATRDNNVPVRFNNAGYLINFGTSVGDHAPGETTSEDFIRYRGGNYTENTRFGHELVLHRTTDSFNIATLTMGTNSKYNGYYILGIKSVEIESNPGVYIDFTVSREITPPYKIDSYVITVTGYPDTNIIINCYTGSKFLEDYTDNYSISNSLKFFELSKQGRGVIDCYEMIEVIAEEEGATGVYVIDTSGNNIGNKPIIAIATKSVTATDAQGNYVQGTPFAYEYNASGSPIPIFFGGSPNINRSLPVLNSSEYTENLLPTIIKVTATSGKTRIRIPVLVHSFVAKTDSSYNFYYKTIPYQGLLKSSSSVYGKIMSEGSGIITTLGSGSVNNINYTGTATFVQGTRSITGSGNYWARYTQAGDFVRQSGSNKFYRINSVADNQLILAEVFVEDPGTAPHTFEIIRIDIPASVNSNVIDRLPSLKIISSSSEYITDYKCYSDTLNSLSNFIIKNPSHKIQDPLVSISNDFKLGSDAIAKRGRNNFKLTDGLNDLYKIGEGRAYIIYESTTGATSTRNKKVFQFYLFNRSGKDYYGITDNPDLTGKLYMMVISGETINSTSNILNPYLDRDTVDIFELEGRPIIKG